MANVLEKAIPAYETVISEVANLAKALVEGTIVDSRYNDLLTIGELIDHVVAIVEAAGVEVEGIADVVIEQVKVHYGEVMMDCYLST